MIKENVRSIIKQLSSGIDVVAVAKARGVAEIQEAISAGISIVGENYVQEAKSKQEIIGRVVKWHLIGHLQSNKVKEAVEIFDMIETIDSVKIAEYIDKACQLRRKIMPVLVEVNSACEKNKTGLFPEDMISFVEQLRQFRFINVVGLMTMGPNVSDAEELRPYFRQTRQIFDKIKVLNYPEIEMKFLSMGMTDSYLLAIEEGANIVRIGRGIFGQRYG